jgi:hypothetical protein
LHHYLSSKPPRGFDITEAWHQPAGYKVNHEKAAKGTAVGSELELIFGLFHIDSTPRDLPSATHILGEFA